MGIGIAAHAVVVLFISGQLSDVTLILLMASMMGSSILSALLLGALMAREDRQIRREANLSDLANFDPLTKVANRRVYDEAVARLAKGPASQPYSILIVDLDHFKSINDRYGHAAGDLVLQAVGAKLKRAAGEDATVARFGGEEFVVLLKNTPHEEATAVAEAIRHKIADWPESTGEQAICVTASIGFATANRGSAPDQVLRRADDALYDAKKSGRNCVRSDRLATTQQQASAVANDLGEDETYAKAS